MNLVKAFKKQADDETKAHVARFESSMAFRKDTLTKFLDEKAGTMYEDLLILKTNQMAD